MNGTVRGVGYDWLFGSLREILVVLKQEVSSKFFIIYFRALSQSLKSQLQRYGVGK